MNSIPTLPPLDASSPIKQNIKKIVYVMMENRSFDNLLGWLYDGNPSPNVNNIPDNGPPVKFYGLTNDILTQFAQPITYETWGHDVKPIVKGVEQNYFPCVTPIWDPNEEFLPVFNQVFGPYMNYPVPENTPPTMKGFLQNYYDTFYNKADTAYLEILDTYNNNQVPVINFLAKNFAVSDLWHCSIPSQTSINRAFSISGNSVGWMTEADRSANITTAMVNNHYYSNEAGLAPAQFSCKTIWNVLCEAGFTSEADWRIYYSNVWPPAIVKGTTSYTYQMFPGLQYVLNNSITSPKDKMYKTIDKFYEDAANDNLPSFTYIEPDYSLDYLGDIGYTGNDYHPPSDVKYGEEFLRKIYNALFVTGNPNETLLIISFDEHGGTLDHVAPPWGALNPTRYRCQPTQYEYGFQFNLYGVRVPTIFVSPWIKQNTVIRSGINNMPFDHTAFLATLMDWFGLTARKAELGDRVYWSRRFDAVISNDKRSTMPAPPPVWNCQSSKANPKEKLNLNTAVRVAKIIGLTNNMHGTEVLKDILNSCTTTGQLMEYYRKSMTLKEKSPRKK